MIVRSGLEFFIQQSINQLSVNREDHLWFSHQ